MPSRTPLQVSESRAAELVAAVLDRRRRSGDPDLVRASDDVLGVVRHVAGHRRVAAAVLHEDTLDALELLEYARVRLPALPGAYDALEYELLSRRRDAQVSLADVAARLGVTRQAVDLRLRRGRAASNGLARSELADRAHETIRQEAARWRRDRALAVRTVIVVFGRHVDELRGDGHLVDLVEILLAPDDDRRPPAVTDPVTEQDLVLLRRVLAAARASTVFGALDGDSRIRAATEQGDRLIREYDVLTADVERFRRR
ncbi:hypothetical protein [Actinosynnema sp. NPDC023587]|uniref:hypothetical protein n=1 Tax=Actinosynnema sp. NPDC023587 TaxID=3154695 RepID=UPI0033F095D8